MKFNKREKKIIEELNRKLKNSPSHDINHSIKVAEYSFKLLNKYGGNREVIPAALLHDLGRQKKLTGIEHIKSSSVQAEKILKRCDYKKEEIERIKKCIERHDDPLDKESKILYDADKLSGFGALGIARIFMHCGEMGEDIKKGIFMLEKRVPERVKKLNFEYSKKLSEKKNQIVKEFLKQIKEETNT